MTIQIANNQIKDATIQPGKIDLTASFDFSSGTLQAATPSASSDVATKAYVDSLVPDGFQAGNGISIDTGTSPDTISVLAAADGALQFIGVGSNELSVKLDGSTLSKSANGVKVADAGIADAQIASGAAIAISKLAASTISGVSLGSNLFALSASGVLSMSSYDGSAAISNLQLNYDAGMFDNSLGSLIIKDAAITNAKLADGSISEAKLQNDAVTSFKLATDSVVTLKIANAAVTQAKLANDSVGSAQIINASVGTDELALGAVTQAKIANLAVGTGQMADASVTSAKLALNAVATGNIQGGAVTQAKLANDSVGSAQIINGSVAAAELATDAVETAKIQNAAVTSAKLASASVDASKLANASVGMAALNVQSYWSSFVTNGATTAFDLAKPLDSKFQQLMVFRNGMALEQVASAPSGVDQYSVSLSGGTGGVGQITFGAAPAASDVCKAFYIAAV